MKKKPAAPVVPAKPKAPFSVRFAPGVYLKLERLLCARVISTTRGGLINRLIEAEYARQFGD
jgi:hypothetical protein